MVSVDWKREVRREPVEGHLTLRLVPRGFGGAPYSSGRSLPGACRTVEECWRLEALGGE